MVKISYVAAIVVLHVAAVVYASVDRLVDVLNATDILALPRTARRYKTPEACQTSDGFTGTCMSRFSCMRQGGAASGFCGTYGVCCEINVECGASSKQKRIVFKNPVTLPTNGFCNYVIEPYSPQVCQLRIDFEKFSLQQPRPQPAASEVIECGDRFLVNNLVLCGNNDQQHLYLPFSVAGGNDHVQLRFELPERWAGSAWRLVVTQLECPAPKRRSLLSAANPFAGRNTLNELRTIFTTHNSDLEQLAPSGCLQYHTGRQGEVRSFNYNNGAGPYLPEMSYAVCFKRLPGDSMVQFTTESFALSQQRDAQMYAGFDEECHGTVVTSMRKEDYVMVPRALLVPAATLQPTYFCGSALKKGDVILSGTEGPLVMYFNSDAITDDTDRGFLFQYEIQ